MKRITTAAQQAVLELLEFHKGHLKPEDVLTAANANRESPLGQCFEWDDAAAAEEHRIDTARRLIQIVKVRVHPLKRETIRATVSLPSDRAVGNGYRSTAAVLEDAALRQELIRSRLDDVHVAVSRCELLDELAPFVAQARTLLATAWESVVTRSATG